MLSHLPESEFCLLNHHLFFWLFCRIFSFNVFPVAIIELFDILCMPIFFMIIKRKFDSPKESVFLIPVQYVLIRYSHFFYYETNHTKGLKFITLFLGFDISPNRCCRTTLLYIYHYNFKNITALSNPFQRQNALTELVYIMGQFQNG